MTLIPAARPVAASEEEEDVTPRVRERRLFLRLIPAAAVVLCTGLAARFLCPGAVRFEVGAFAGGFLGKEWSRSSRAELDPQATTDARTSFYYRAAPVKGDLFLPLLVVDGPLRLTLRGTAGVRSALAVFVSGEPAGEVLIRPGPWERYPLEVLADHRGSSPLNLSLVLRPLPLVRGGHIENPQVFVDYLEVEARSGLRLSAGACSTIASVPLFVLLFARRLGCPWRCAILTGAVAGAAGLALLRTAPLAVLLGAPRLVPVALAAGLLAHALLKHRLPSPEPALHGLLVAAGVLFHGSLVFFPDHNPPDIDIHVRRTLDLPSVPLDYRGILEYGSQLPTPSQDRGAATEALGAKVLIPYSPLPYVAYYALHAMGLDLYWAMTVANAVLAMAVAPCLWLFAARFWGRGAAWLASLLYSLDLAVWHHVGRSHAPAAFGGALGTAALLYVAMRAERLVGWREVLRTGSVLALAVLAYSSLVVLLGLTGLVLLTILAFDARSWTREARRGVALALVVGGLLAGGLFYFHYVPGLLRGAAAVEAEPDRFPGATYFVFHNESRQSLRIWKLGFATLLAAGLLAAPLALRRAAPSVRPILVSWVAAWGLIMVLKEPLLFPKLLRWAKEDQFLSPLLCVLIAGAAWSLPRAWMRWGGSLLAVAVALRLELRDFALHANSLQL